jgi:flagellar biosynthetic protein FliR
VALGVVTRAAPQLNIFAVGFPITIIVGFVLMLLAAPILQPVFTEMFAENFRYMTDVLRP